MSGLPILSLLVALPLVAGIVALFLSANGARWLALITTLVSFALGVWLWSAYDPSGTQWQFVEYHELGGGIAWAMGIDGIALMLIMLTLFLMPICIGASWRAIE
jgi:NADH-quinone oxidoreductase subunit M